MKKLLVIPVVLCSLFLTGCEDSFLTNCDSLGGTVYTKTNSDYKYAYDVATGQFKWVWVTTTVRTCVTPDGDIADMEVS